MSLFAEQWFWPGYLTLIAALCVLDFVAFRPRVAKVSRHKALIVNVIWVAVAILLVGIAALREGVDTGASMGAIFLASKALSLGEVFIFYLVLWALRIPAVVAGRFLYFTLVLATLLRAIGLVLGFAVLPQRAWAVVLVGVVSLLMALQFLLRSDRPGDVAEHWAVRLTRRLAPFTERMPPRRYTLLEEGRRKGTPLLLAALISAFTALVFAITTFPAAYAISSDPVIGLAGGLLGLVGIRSLYFLVERWGDILSAVKPALTLILSFVGLAAMGAPWARIDPRVSLSILIIIWGTAGAAVWYARHNRPERIPTR